MMKTIDISGKAFPVLGYVEMRAIPLLDLPMLEDQREHLSCVEDNIRYWPANMPYLPVKIKEVSEMSLDEELLELDAAVRCLSQGVNALGLMALGLNQVADPYTTGFNALFCYMTDADQEVHQHLKNCLEAI